jgi:hypothetical protein
MAQDQTINPEKLLQKSFPIWNLQASTIALLAKVQNTDVAEILQEL